MHGNVWEWVQDGGIVTITKRQQTVVHGKVEMTLTGLFVEVAGAAAPRAVGRRIVSAAIWVPARAFLAFAL